MFYKSFSLNGAWYMDFSETEYVSEKVPAFSGSQIFDAVPGYWEDMKDKFEYADFSVQPKINPDYYDQHYPINAERVPDTILPNFKGNFFYKRSFSYDGEGKACAVHFYGVQNTVRVWINGEFAGRHEGYSEPFDIEIPENLLRKGENEIVFSVSNFRMKGYNDEPVSGITSRAVSESTGGIIGDVEIREYTGALRDVAVLISEDLMTATASISLSKEAKLSWKVMDGECVIKSGEANGDFSFDTEGLELWSPESPRLYTLVVREGDAEISRSFGVRRLLVDGPHLRLNGVPVYLRGICEHCYYPETIHPTTDINHYRFVIGKLKELGFNYIRFHTHIPAEEYMLAADELGILVLVESPNNTSLSEWEEIVAFCRRHTSVIGYCCGNELMMEDPFIEHIKKCSECVHANTDALFAPMSAMRGLEYEWEEPGIEAYTIEEPFRHHPRRIREVANFSDIFNSYHADGLFSYESMSIDCEEFDAWSVIYHDKPRITHELCIDGTYTDLSLKPRYEGTPFGKTDYFGSIERHLTEKGLIDRAPLYFKNSSEWQRRCRKYCFEAARRCEKLAGYDFLGPIDTHWHTFGYDVGMMNEFYELKPGETVENVLMYNSETVLVTDLRWGVNVRSGDELRFNVLVSHYGKEEIKKGELLLKLMDGDKAIFEKKIAVSDIPNGKVSKLYEFCEVMPGVSDCRALKLQISLSGDGVSAKNEWELYLYPRVEAPDFGDIVVSDGMSEEELESLLKEGRDVLLLGTKPFRSLPTAFKIGLAGRSGGNYATVVEKHPATECMPNEGFCGWQFAKLFEKGNAVCFEDDSVPFNPIIDVASSHKYIIRQSALFEFKAYDGRVLVCSFNFEKDEPSAEWFLKNLVDYMKSEKFSPCDTFTDSQFKALCGEGEVEVIKNTNFAFNANDITAVRTNKE